MNGPIDPTSEGRLPELSVIVPTRNRAALLRRCLDGLGRQNLDPSRFEVLVVDNGSSDETMEVVREAEEQGGFRLRVFSEPRPGLHRARHEGMKQARAPRLVFADDDIVPEPGWLGAIVEAFSSAGVVLVGGRNLPDWEVAPPVWLARAWERDRAIGALSVLDAGDELQPIDPQWVWGCNFSIDRQVLEETGGFHPDAMPDALLRFRGDGETHVTRHVARQRYRTLYHPGATVRHYVPASRMTVAYFQRRAFAQGVSESFTDLRARDGRASPRSRWRDVLAHVAGYRVVDFAGRHLLPWRWYFGAATAAAAHRGYHWHQEQFLEDEAVREWVMAADYRD